MQAEAGPGRARPGRAVGSPPNRETILAVARSQFGHRGYDATTIRSIAAGAGVDPALIHHYFGSKDQLFAEAAQFPIAPAELVPQLLAGGIEGLGERLLRRLLQIWASDRTVLVGLIRSAASHEYAARMLREFVTREILERIADSLEMPQPRLRAALVASQVVGLAMA